MHEQTPQNVVQIHHDHIRCHWYTSTNLNGPVQIFDSRRPNVLSNDVELQVKKIYALPQGCSIALPLPSQDNANDCGIFAIAFAVDLCHGIEPSRVTYIKTGMRAVLKVAKLNGFHQ